MIQNCYRSVDHHFQNGAVIVQRDVLPIKVANPAVMLKRDSITKQLPLKQDQTLLTFHSPSFAEWGCDYAVCRCAYKGGQSSGYDKKRFNPHKNYHSYMGKNR